MILSELTRKYTPNIDEKTTGTRRKVLFFLCNNASFALVLFGRRGKLILESASQ